MPFPSPLRRWLLPALLGVGGLALTACGHADTQAASSPPVVTISVSQCGQGWTSPHSGQQQFNLKNTDSRPGEVYLTDPDGAVFAYVDPLGPNATAMMSVDLGSGRYTFRCAMEDEDVVTGPVVTIPGHVAQPVKPVQPVTQADLIASVQQYQHYVTGQIPTLRGLTNNLAAALRSGDRAAAERAWLPAHLEYERLGAAYGAFGDFDGEINGLPDGLPGSVHDPDWAGFHRVEYGLWHGETLSGLTAPTTALTRAVNGLGQEFATAQIDPLELSIRAHEISENALQFELTGRTDFGSHSNLATVQANLAGTKVVLDILKPLLTPRMSALPTVYATLGHADKTVATVVGKPLTALTRQQHDAVDAAISQLTEQLAPVASILEPRRV